MGISTALQLEDEFEVADQPAGPCVMVVFGAAGDLTRRKLVPALYNLAKEKLLPRNFAVLGVSVDELNTDQFREQLTQFLQDKDHTTEVWEWFTGRLNYLHGDFDDPITYSQLVLRLREHVLVYDIVGNNL